VAVARVVAASLAADAGWSVDDIDDVRLALDELLGVLVDAGDDGARVQLEMAVHGDSLEVTGTLEGASAAAEPDELSRRIIEAVADEYELGPASFRLSKAPARQ
jgi:hypothetical protein